MGTDKRARHKAGHAARLEVERSMQKRARTRSRILKVGAGIVGVIVAVVLLRVLSDDSSTTTTAASTTTTSAVSTSTTPALESAAGKPCVALADALPTGAPTVDVPIGPPPTTLQITDLKEGEGTPVVRTDSVTVNYIGVSCSTGTIFDSSWSRGQTATFGLDEVITGWTEGLVGMKPGGERLLVIPPDLAYGSAGSPPKIAPDETLIFVVDLVSATPSTSSTLQ